MSKKMLAILLAIACMLSMAACGQKKDDTSAESGENATVEEEQNADELKPFILNSEEHVVLATDCDDRGYVGYIVDGDGTYKVTIQNPEGESYDWKIYLSDTKFEDATRYIPDSLTPALEGEGTVEVKDGQYMYIYTSANSFDLGDKEVPKDASLTIVWA